MKAKILYVIINLEIGGSERQLGELLRGLDRERFVPQVCCLSGGGALKGEVEALGIPVTVFRTSSGDYSGKARAARVLLSQVVELRRLMRRERPAIVHGVLPMACVTAGIAAACARVPVLVTSRRCLGYYKERRLLLRELENLVNVRADAVVANAEAVRLDTLARERIHERKIRVIHNGVRLPPDRGASSWRGLVGREIEGPAVCLIANFFAYKGHKDFLTAAAIVHEKVPEVKFVLVGDGRLRAEIERTVRELKLTESVALLGSRADAAGIMRMCDIVTLASHEEGFPNVVLEAMAAGKPVVATSVGGVPEAVEEGRTGYLVPPRSPEKLAAAIVRLLMDRGEAEAMGKRGRERAEREFSIEKMVRSYEELYEELLGKAGRARCGEVTSNRQ